jgi:hypothetical protein
MSFPSSDETRRRRGGAILVILGLALFILQYIEGAAESILFFGIAAVFLFFYFRQQRYGFLVPGCILAGIGLGMLIDNSSLDAADPGALGMGIGFLMIYGIDRLFRGRTSWWPLVPGGIMLFGAIRSGSGWANRILTEGWPLILVIVGLLVFMGKLNWGRERDPGPQPVNEAAEEAEEAELD